MCSTSSSTSNSTTTSASCCTDSSSFSTRKINALLLKKPLGSNKNKVKSKRNTRLIKDLVEKEMTFNEVVEKYALSKQLVSYIIHEFLKPEVAKTIIFSNRRKKIEARRKKNLKKCSRKGCLKKTLKKFCSFECYLKTIRKTKEEKRKTRNKRISKYYYRHREKILEWRRGYQRKYYEENREKLNEQARERRRKKHKI